MVQLLPDKNEDDHADARSTRYGEDKDLTEGYRKELWQDY